MIKYGVSRKIVSCQYYEFANIYGMIWRAFQPTILEKGFTGQFLQKDFNDYVDFDSIPIGRSKNNELIVICNKSENNMQGNNEKKVCDNYGKDSSKSEESESESEHSL